MTLVANFIDLKFCCLSFWLNQAHFMDHSGAISPAFGMSAGLPPGFTTAGMPPLQQLQAHLLRSGPLAGSLPGSPFLHHTGLLHGSPFSAHQSLYMPNIHHSLNMKQEVYYVGHLENTINNN